MSAALTSLQSALDEKGPAAALHLCQQWLAQSPQETHAHRYLGQLQAMRGERALALRAANRACELAPQDARCWSDLGRIRALFEEYAAAAECFERAVRIEPQYADGWHNLGTSYRKLGRREPAFDALKTALQLDPARADTYVNLGNLLIDAGQLADAVECFERAARHDPKMAAARSRLAEQVSQLGKVHEAQTLFRQSIALDPAHLQGWLGLARTLEDLGDAENALACYRNVLASRPDHALATGHYLALLREAAPEPLLDHARRILTNPAVQDEAQALVGYGLAKYCDRRGEHAAAATAALAANSARRRSMGGLDRESLAARIDNVITTYDAAFFFERRRFGLGTDQPVFIVGLPRSGTTLCEQILASHPMLHGAGELKDLGSLAGDVVEEGQAPWSAAACLDEMKSRGMALRYLRALRNGAPRRRTRISDKSPLNFFQLAFAAVLFPNARIIHCTRDARDNALSIWMENFNPDQRYATDFEDLAFFRAQYQRLMAHWQSVLPLRMLELNYEETVQDVAAQARKLISFLDVPWDDRCLEFHRNDRAVQTPSRWQVRQPIYSKSVQRWRHYEQHLPQLLSAFPRAATTP